MKEKIKKVFKPIKESFILKFGDGKKNIYGALLLFILALVMLFGFDWHAEGIFFWLFFVSLFYWKIDSRVSIGMALGGLVTIMLLLAVDGFGFIPSWEWQGNLITMHLGALAEKVAVWVYFFLVIGVVRQIWEYRVDSKDEL